jgi:hypothetical protein
MRRLLIVALALSILIPALRFAGYSTSYAQSTPGIGIGTSTPHASAILDIDFVDKGVLFPRLTTAQRDGISSPAAGLLIYNSEANVLQVYDGSAWQSSTTP